MGEFWNSRHGPSMYTGMLFCAHCAGPPSCTGNPWFGVRQHGAQCSPFCV